MLAAVVVIVVAVEVVEAVVGASVSLSALESRRDRIRSQFLLRLPYLVLASTLLCPVCHLSSRSLLGRVDRGSRLTCIFSGLAEEMERVLSSLVSQKAHTRQGTGTHQWRLCISFCYVVLLGCSLASKLSVLFHPPHIFVRLSLNPLS